MSHFRTTSHTIDPTSGGGGLFCPNDSYLQVIIPSRESSLTIPAHLFLVAFLMTLGQYLPATLNHSASFFWLISAGGPFLTGLSPQFLGFYNILISSALQCPWTSCLMSSWWNPQPPSWQPAAISSPNILDILLSSSLCLCAAGGTG